MVDPFQDAVMTIRVDSGDGNSEDPCAAPVEAWRQVRLALPMMGTNVLQSSVQLVSLMFVGHLSELDLSSASIATSLAGVTGYSFLLGLSTALETMCGQAYGAKRYRMLGIYMQRAILVLAMIAMPIAVMWFNMEKVLLLLGQAPDIAQRAGIYARFLIPGLFAYAFLQPIIKFLQTQSAVIPMFISSSVALLVHVLLCWTLVFKLNMGSKGAAISSSISNWLNVIFLLLVVSFTPKCKECWKGLSREALQDIRMFVKLAIPSALMVCLEWWAFEALVLLSGRLSNPQLETSVLSIMLNTLSFCYMIPYGLGVAASTRISNELGAGHPKAARFAFLTAICLTAVNGVVVSSTLLLSRNMLGKVFSNQGEVAMYVSRLAPILAWISVMDAIQSVLSGVSRGCGWQSFAAVANLGAYYVVGVPLALILTFVVGLGGKGLVIGLAAGVSTQAAAYMLIAFLTDWSKQADAAYDRLTQQSFPLLPK